MPQERHIIVVGAGVTGLTSAYFLAEEGYKVTVVAAHVPGDESIEYTSPWAGAHWRTSATPDQPTICDWDVQTYDYWIDVLNCEDADSKLPKSGLKMQTSNHYWDAQPTESLWWAPHVQNFHQLSTVAGPVSALNDSIPGGSPKIAWAASCRAPSINVPQYLLYLRAKAEGLGVSVIKSRLPTISGLETALDEAERVAMECGRPKADLFINATGLGAAKLCNDQMMYPIRGQTVLVRGEAHATRTRSGDGYVAYCIPRPGSGMTILGGTKEVGVWSEAVDPATTAIILERNQIFAPELLTGADGGFEVVSVQVGLRPGREGGPRVEGEVVGGRLVVHGYGHGSGGYQNSVGSARMVVGLVDEAFGARGGASAKL
ncbi:uncharacterized protein LTR77_001603 [Saxophila tyrrhenica]|uniref:FAD dependent oxidoreductase domain-containing protein n=1 Tax=Saxophila tyrrhenica TaxID=1690608 RepID=A0AAV9PKW0_9PEZI|nr:hypothetical protein LTR77_001603 [Saxophila tyrrhenica]